MIQILTQTKLSYYISRKTPCIIFYQDKIDETNKYVISIMEKMKKEFKYVLCYLADWRKCLSTNNLLFNQKSSDVLSFQNNKVTFKISAFEEDRLRNLFKTVYNDSINNFFPCFSKILKNEHSSDEKYLYELYKIENPSYNINRQITNRNNSKNLSNKYEYPSKTNNKISKGKHNKNIESDYNQKTTSFDTYETVPVKSGLPNIKIFFVPLDVIPINKYFKNSPKSLKSRKIFSIHEKKFHKIKFKSPEF